MLDKKVMIDLEQEKIVKVVLLAAYFSKRDEGACQEHLDELANLSNTLGLEVEGRFPCFLRKCESKTYFTKGKLAEAVAYAKGLKVDLVVLDDEITPSQQRNIEEAFGCKVIDRTEVILEVFAKRAQTKEAQIQIDIAKVQYQIPRLKRLWTHLHRQGGGSGLAVKGEGEKQLELDKRLLSHRLEKLKRDLKDVCSSRETQRTARERAEVPTFALIGYTNVGKSTLMNALTEAGVLVEDKLFATLDTTTRKYILSNNQEVLLIDTVGFIRKLPHDLVEAFKSTLEEAFRADILLHLVDISHPYAIQQSKAVYDVLKELNVRDKAIITVLNKGDVCDDQEIRAYMNLHHPENVEISALEGTGFDLLGDRMIEELKDRRQKLCLRIPQSDYRSFSNLLENGEIIEQEYEGNDILVKAEVPRNIVFQFEKFIVEEVKDGE